MPDWIIFVNLYFKKFWIRWQQVSIGIQSECWKNTDTFYAVQMICKSFKKFKNCPSVNNNLYEKPDSLVQILSDDSLKVIPTPLFVGDFSSTSCESDNFMGSLYRVCGLRLGPKFEVRPTAAKNLLLVVEKNMHFQSFSKYICHHMADWSGINFTGASKCIN